MFVQSTELCAREPASLRERLIASGFILALALAVAFDVNYASAPWPAILAIVPTVESIAVGAWILSAWTLFALYRMRGYGPFAILACAFGTAAATHVANLATFPGVFAPPDAPFTSPQATLWLATFGRLTFDALAIAYVFAERRERRAAGSAQPLVRPIVIATLVAVIGETLLATLAFAHLPATLASARLAVLASAPGQGVLAALLAFTAIASALVLRFGGSRSRVPLWLFVVLCAGFAELVSSRLLSPANFSNAWYLAQLDTLAEASIFVLVMQVQLGTILRGARRTGERAHALSEILAVSSQSSVDLGAMLERVAREFGYEVAFLARHSGDELVVEIGTGGHKAAQRGNHIALEKTLSRHVVGSRTPFVIDDLSAPGWRTDPSGKAGVWSSFCAVPVFVADAPYGVLGFCNVEPRELPLSALERDFMGIVGVLVGNALERAQQRERLDALAYFDSLTGLANRAHLTDRIGLAVATAERYGGRLAVHFLDLDGFKPINDHYGHAVGDLVLREVGRRLSGMIRTTDVVGRYGGDEFVVLQPVVADVRNVTDLGARLARVFNEPFEIDGAVFAVGASIGVSIYPDHGRDAQALLAAADADLYRAKDARRAAQRTAPATIY